MPRASTGARSAPKKTAAKKAAKKKTTTKKATSKATARKVTKRRRLAQVEKAPTKKSPFKVQTQCKLTPALVDAFAELIKKGATIDLACDYLEINHSTYSKWSHKGQLFLDGGGEPEEFECYAYFVREVRKAAAAFRLSQTEAWLDKTNTSWQRNAAMLERRDRHHYSKRDPIGGDEESMQPDKSYM